MFEKPFPIEGLSLVATVSNLKNCIITNIFHTNYELLQQVRVLQKGKVLKICNFFVESDQNRTGSPLPPESLQSQGAINSVKTGGEGRSNLFCFFT